MTLILNQSDWEELHEQASITCSNDLILEDFEELSGISEYLGRGYFREVELLPGVQLKFIEQKFHCDWKFKETVHQHPIQIALTLLGFVDCDIYPTIDSTRSYFSGSGISPAYVENNQSSQQVAHLSIEIAPEVMESVFLDTRQQQSDTIKQLFRGEDWKVSFYPKVTPAMRSLVHQIWNAPYRGAAKRLYLQGKVFELLAMHLDLIAEDGVQNQAALKLKPSTIDRLHQAREILSIQFAQPPSLPELAQQVGLSNRSLQRGFQTLFKTTIANYLKQRRLEQAEQLFRQGDRTVAEVALQVGYGHLGRFAAAFKQQFGITPSECLAGKRVIQLDSISLTINN